MGKWDPWQGTAAPHPPQGSKEHQGTLHCETTSADPTRESDPWNPPKRGDAGGGVGPPPAGGERQGPTETTHAQQRDRGEGTTAEGGVRDASTGKEEEERGTTPEREIKITITNTEGETRKAEEEEEEGRKNERRLRRVTVGLRKEELDTAAPAVEVSGRIGGKQCRILVDTGASVTVVSTALWNKGGKTMGGEEKDEVELVTADGGRTMATVVPGGKHTRHSRKARR